MRGGSVEEVLLLVEVAGCYRQQVHLILLLLLYSPSPVPIAYPPTAHLVSQAQYHALSPVLTWHRPPTPSVLLRPRWYRVLCTEVGERGTGVGAVPAGVPHYAAGRTKGSP
eukprot:100558-Rhodomonas_salina.1